MFQDVLYCVKDKYVCIIIYFTSIYTSRRCIPFVSQKQKHKELISGTESNTRLEQNTDGPVGETAASAIFMAGKAHLFLVPSARTAVIMTL